MSDYWLVTLGGMDLVCTDVEIGPAPREYGVMSNPLAGGPVQTCNYQTGYRDIRMTVRLSGVETQNETAAVHLERQLANVEAVVRGGGSVSIRPWGFSSARTYRVVPSPGFSIPITQLMQSRSVWEGEVVLQAL